jgi:hypothetical protein
VPRAPLFLLPFCLFIGALTPIVSAATTGDQTEGFSVQVSPSPLIGTLTPGKLSTFDLQIRNTSTQPQALKMGLRAFSVDGTSGKVDLKNDPPELVKDFVSFSNPTFNVAAGEIYTQRITVNTPSTAGFTYSFAVVISQQNPPKAGSGQSAIQGSVAVFTLLSVDRPGATSKLQLEKVTINRHVFEYLPATVSVKLRNSGNTLVQPRGNIYIQRHADDTKPLTVLDLNSTDGYILPGSSRTISADWTDGLPHYKTVTTGEGQSEQKLDWSGGDFTKLRFGKYVAKVVAIYNDGGRDVPLEADITFWVIPWRILLVCLVIVAIIVVGLFTILRKSGRALKLPARRIRKGQDADKN